MRIVVNITYSDALSTRAALLQRSLVQLGEVANVSHNALLELHPERRQRLRPGAIPRTRTQRRYLVMDIVEDRRQRMFVCIVQRDDSPAILMMCQFSTRQAAVLEGEKFISEYLRCEQCKNSEAA